MQGILKASPEDMLLTINYNNTKTELDMYLNSRAIEEQNIKITAIEESNAKIIEDTELIKEQQKYVCDRTNFSEKMKIMANKYFGRDIQEAYGTLYAKMKTLGSFDVFIRRNNKWKDINADRIEQGKKAYKDSTLKQKYNMLDVIDERGKWELCSEAYKTIEMEKHTSNN